MSETAAPPSKPGREAPRWMRVLLVVSLGLNLLTVGLIASAVWHMRHMAGFGVPGRLSVFVENLPADRAAALRTIVNDARPSLRPLRQAAWQARREAARLFVAEPFDREKYAAAQARLFELELQVRRAHLQVITDVASQLTADERKAYLRWRGHRWRRALPDNHETNAPEGRVEGKAH